MKWQHPFSAIIAGPSNCGKSYFVKRFLKRLGQMVDTDFKHIIFYYSEWQNTYLEMGKNIDFHEGLPQVVDFAGDKKPKLIIIDDLMRESSDKTVVDIFTKYSHHKNVSVIYLTQNLFHQGRGQRDISLNAHYIVVFKNPRDRAQIQHFGRQLYPDNSKFIQEAYNDATNVPHGYLLIDLKQSTDETCRVRTCIFPDDAINYVYVPQSIKRGNHHGNVSVVRE